MSEERNDDKLWDKMKDGATSTGKKVGKKAAKVAGNAASKASKKLVKLLLIAIKSLILTFLPVIIGVSLIISLGIAANDIFFETRGPEQTYTLEEDAYDNTTKRENNGSVSYDVTTSYSRENKMVRTFFDYEAAMSFYKTKDGKELIGRKEKEEKFDELKDFYGKEKQFYLNSDFLYTLDEQMHQGAFIYPEQFILPVYYDKTTLTLKQLTEKDEGNSKTVIAESTKYGEDGKPLVSIQPSDGATNVQKEKGVWDYGLAPILKYGDYQIIDTVEGTYTSEEYADKQEDGSYEVKTRKINKPFNEVMDDFPKDINLIDKAITFVGNIEYKYRIDHTKVRPLKEKLAESENDDGTKVEYSSYTDEDGDEHPLYRYRTGYVWEERPVEDAVIPDLVGDEYIRDYLYNYKIYVPKSVMDGFNFKNRTGEEWEKIVGKIATPGTAGNVNYGIETGSNASGNELKDAIENSGTYMDQYCAEFGISDPYLLYALIAQESAGNLTAKTGAATGLMQVIPGHELKAHDASGNLQTYTPTEAELLTADGNIRAGVMEFKQALEREDVNGDYLKAMYIYNCGIGCFLYIKEHYPEAMATSDWLNYREEARKWGAESEGYYNSCSASDPGCPAGQAWGDAKYLENVLRHYAGTGSYLTGGAGADVSDSIRNQRSEGIFETIWKKFKQGVSEMFHADYKPEEPRKEIDKFAANVEKVDDIIKLTKSFEDKKLFSENDDLEPDFWDKNYSMIFMANSKFGENNANMLAGSPIPQEMLGMSSPFKGLTPTIGTQYGIENPQGEGGSSKAHQGVDLLVPEGTPVYSVSDGKVSDIDNKQKCVTIQHTNGTKAKYCNMGSIKVSKGSSVSKGDEIGTSGSAGESSNPHLHFEFLINDNPVNPTAIVMGQASFDTNNIDDSTPGGKAAKEAIKYLGIPYQYGATGPKTFDCSGLTQWAYKHGAGIDISRTTWTQANDGTAISSPEAAQIGDLLISNKGQHVSLYLGGGMKIHAPQTGDVVKIAKVNWSDVTAIRRIG